MTHENVAAMLEEVGLPLAYDHFAEGESPNPPFLIFLFPGSDNFSADGKVYFKTDRLNVELYTDTKQPDLEERLENILDAHELYYEKSEVWIEEEKMYEALYEMEVAHNGKE